MTAITIIVTKLADEVNWPSVTLYVNEVIPLKFSSGINVAILPSINTKPSAESWSSKKTNSSPSISSPWRIISTSISSNVSVDNVSVIIGASFTGLTVKTKLSLSVYSPSLTLTVTAIGPL